MSASFPNPTVAVIVGGSSGIGAATAHRLAEAGVAVVIGYNTGRDRALALAASLPSQQHHSVVRIRSEDQASLAEAVAFVGERYGRVDILVNSGGSTQRVAADDLDGLTDEIFDRIVQVNLRGPFSVIRAFRRLLEVPQGSVIVNVSSISARTGIGSNLAYCANKAGLDSLTIGLAKALAPKIRVFSVSPGGVDTGFVPGRTPEQLAASAERTPLKHLTTADDVAAAIFACARYLTSSTGIVVDVDEGRHL